MIIETLFGPEDVPARHNSLKFKVIRAVFDTITVKDAILEYSTLSSVHHCHKFSNVRITSARRAKNISLPSTWTARTKSPASTGFGRQPQRPIVHPREVFKTALLSSRRR